MAFGEGNGIGWMDWDWMYWITSRFSTTTLQVKTSKQTHCDCTPVQGCKNLTLVTFSERAFEFFSIVCAEN